MRALPLAPWLAIIGINEDGPAGLSAQARALLESAVLVAGGARHLALAAPLIRGETLAWPSPLQAAFPAILARRGQAVAVLASGDPNWFGIAETLRLVVPPAETLCLPAPSAFALACARLGWAMQDIDTLSACGRPIEAVLPALRPGAKLLVLSADSATPAALAALLTAHGFGDATLHVLEALGGPRERIRSTTAADGVPDDIAALNLVGIEPRSGPAIARAPGLPEARFEHDGQITKREIRAVALAALAPRAGEMLWDIGCGSGSVAIEWSLAHPACRAIGIEARPDRAERARRNALALGVPQLRVVAGHAPEALDGLPAADAVFVGGGARTPGLLETLWRKLPPGGRLVAHAVTIETQTRLFAMQAEAGGTLTRIGIERLDALGPALHGFRPAMAVVQWTAEKA